MPRPVPFLLALAFACDANAQIVSMVPDGRSPVSRPLLLVAPQYPGNVTGDRHVEVQVYGTVNRKGRLVDASFSTADADGQPFVEAVRMVLDAWRFVPAVRDCRPAEGEAHLHVWFERKNGRTSISAALQPDDEDAATDFVGPLPGAPRVKAEPDIGLPWQAMRSRIEGVALALVRIGASGDVLDRSILAASPIEDFDKEVLDGLRKLRYEPLDAQWGSRTACQKIEVRFCMREEALLNYAEPRCRRGWTSDRFGALEWKAGP